MEKTLEKSNLAEAKRPEKEQGLPLDAREALQLGKVASELLIDSSEINNNTLPNPEEIQAEIEEALENGDYYRIFEVNGGFKIILPEAVFEESSGSFDGPTAVLCKTMEEVDAAIERSLQDVRNMHESESLEKSYEASYNIARTPDGKFEVTLPKSINSESADDSLSDLETKLFDDWQSAKEYYLQARQDAEKLIQRAILNFQVSEHERFALSHFEAFNPQVAPTDETYALPEFANGHIDKCDGKIAKNINLSTYRETIKDPEWKDKLYSFISSYIEERGAKMAQDIGISRLDTLSPKQAIELSTQIVVELTKYNTNYTKKKFNKADTPADKSSTLELLEEGLAKKGNLLWKGNGVCRNFANMVKAVFESLKANQTDFNMLRNTYCLYESRSDFALKRKYSKRDEKKAGHAWNTFLTISQDGETNAVMVDATWARQNLKTKQIEGLDYTLERMEPLVSGMSWYIGETTPNKEEQLKHILGYYALKMRFPGKEDGVSTLKEKRQYYTAQALQLMLRQGVPEDLPRSFSQMFAREYMKFKDIDPDELTVIHQMSRGNPQLDRQAFVKRYLSQVNRKKLTSQLDYWNYIKGYLSDAKKREREHRPAFRRSFIRATASKIERNYFESLTFDDAELQSDIFEELTRGKSQAEKDKLLEQNSSFRISMRHARPELLPDFSPSTLTADFEELKYFIKRSNNLYHSINHIEQDNLSSWFGEIRTNLRSCNPQKYDKLYAELDDYQTVAQYDNIVNSLLSN